VLDLLRGIALIAATLTMGLMAGLFATFSFAVMPGLARCDDRTFVGAMRQVNRAILNAWFAACFGGAVVTTALALVLFLPGDGGGAPAWIAAALVLYVAVLGITFRLNVPLNYALDEGGDPAGGADPAAVRASFEAPWVRWNVVRAVLNTAAFACLAWALVRYGRALT
jgi:uncharacterized membrane protein